MMERSVVMSLWHYTRFTCAACFDSGLSTSGGGLGNCALCHAPVSGPARRLHQQVDELLGRHQPVSRAAIEVARVLVCATAERPLPGEAIRAAFQIGERELKGLIETLRTDWLLPIGARRAKPSGYYWMATPTEFRQWFETMRAQAICELQTAYHLARANYPELAGQLSFNFTEDER